MQTLSRHLIILLLAMVSLNVQAVDEAYDTVYFYDTWEQMLSMTPSSMLVSPVVEVVNPYEIDIYTTTDDYRLYDHLAATLGDSIWLISTVYLQMNFAGDSHYLCQGRLRYIPVFFSKKVAYLTCVNYGNPISPKEIQFDKQGNVVMNYYYLDFRQRKVRLVTPDVLSELLDDYHDLQMRYEGMKDYKKPEIIEDYFMKFVDQASEDLMRPFILDLTN